MGMPSMNLPKKIPKNCKKAKFFQKCHRMSYYGQFILYAEKVSKKHQTFVLGAYFICRATGGDSDAAWKKENLYRRA